MAWRGKHCWGRWLLDHPVKPDDDNLGWLAAISNHCRMPVSLREFFAFRPDVRPNERSRAGALLVAMLALPRRGNGHGFAAGSGGTEGQINPGGTECSWGGMATSPGGRTENGYGCRPYEHSVTVFCSVPACACRRDFRDTGLKSDGRNLRKPAVMPIRRLMFPIERWFHQGADRDRWKSAAGSNGGAFGKPVLSEKTGCCHLHLLLLGPQSDP